MWPKTINKTNKVSSKVQWTNKTEAGNWAAKTTHTNTHTDTDQTGTAKTTAHTHMYTKIKLGLLLVIAQHMLLALFALTDT